VDFAGSQRASVAGVTQVLESIGLGGHEGVAVGDYVGDPDPAGWAGHADHLADHGGRIGDLVQGKPADNQIELVIDPG